mmetsp:Transcript_9456/g.35411  ORF Transcript_9456/g.35411 Transcript_9456/m.35411 type:complete len:205 (+) Transcript_9456:1688-2302(+)
MQPKWNEWPQGSFSTLQAQLRRRSFMASGTSGMRQMRQGASSSSTAFFPSSSAAASRCSLRRGCDGDSFRSTSRFREAPALAAPLSRDLPRGLLPRSRAARTALASTSDRLRLARAQASLESDVLLCRTSDVSASGALLSSCLVRSLRLARFARSLAFPRSDLGASPKRRALRLRFGIVLLVTPRRTPCARASEAPKPMKTAPR